MIYNAFKSYLSFLHDKVYYKNTYTINKENIPADGTSLLIVSNHQNTLNDALGILFSIRDRKPNFITRGDIFTISPIASKFFRAIGLLPSFRLITEGVEQLGKNQGTFKISEEALVNGKTVVMYPKAGHQDKRWLGTFSFGYTKLAFEAAESSGFEREIFILPSCNHYSDYFGLRNDFMVKFGTPISIKPYYELYKTKPRTAQREVNKLVRAQISSLMLNIDDLENYDAIDFLRITFGEEHAGRKGYDASYLPDRLESDKQMYAQLKEAQCEDANRVGQLYRDALELRADIRMMGVSDKHLAIKTGVWATVIKALGLLLLLPFGIASMWPSLFIYGAGRGAYYKFSKDRMFEGTFMYAISALFTIPICSIISLVLVWVYVNWWSALLYVLLTPAILIFAWNYAKWVKRLWQDIKSVANKKQMSILRNKYNTLHNNLFEILNS